MTGSKPSEPSWRGYFAGEWRVERQVRDALAGRGAEMAGICRFEPLAPERAGDPLALRQTETVETLLEGRRYPATQSYLWRFPPGAPPVLHFADGRMFCAADFGRPEAALRALADGRPARAALAHFCAPDHYEGVLTLERMDRWRLCWRVRGPRKNYHLDALYRRPEAAAAI